MKTRMTLVLLLMLSFFASEAQTLRAELAMARFNSPTEGPYLETYLKFKGNSLKLIKSEDGFHSEVILKYTVNKDGKPVFEDAFKMNGPTLKSDSVFQDFIDVQRIPLEKGDYQLVVSMRDVKDGEDQIVTVRQDFTIEKTIDFVSTMRSGTAPTFDPATGQAMPMVTSSGMIEDINYFVSDIQMVDSYSKTSQRNILSKNGFDLVPFTSNYYPETRKNISIYVEIYNTDTRTINRKKAFGNLFKDKTDLHRYLINLFIENTDDGRILDDLRTFVKHDSAKVIPILHSFPLEDVPSGNYNLVVELRDYENELLERKVMFFQRNNPIEEAYVMPDELTDDQKLDLTFVGKYNRPEELEEYLRCLHPISNQEEILQVNRKMNFNDVTMMKRFMYYFWKRRNPDKPEEAWLKYWKEVEKVNEAYTTNLRKGYDTDRGRVYLQYGPPNTISPNYFEPNTYPYEIWHYYVLRDHISADQSNRKFIFAQTEPGTKEFKLIHSDAKNEITNIRWNYDLHKRSTSTIDLDQEDGGSNYGNRSREFYDNPY